MCHLTENLFDLLRNGEIAITPVVMDSIMEATGTVRDMFGSLEQGMQPGPAAPHSCWTTCVLRLPVRRLTAAALAAMPVAAAQLLAPPYVAAAARTGPCFAWCRCQRSSDHHGSLSSTGRRACIPTLSWQEPRSRSFSRPWAAVPRIRRLRQNVGGRREVEKSRRAVVAAAAVAVAVKTRSALIRRALTRYSICRVKSA